ncbi:hypothetical protein WMY93_006033 [Mugilogobius chulae]|uniref:RRM domain-containing protein n=1 Tax=Mugilogobius chulae TaxID=88201 RepID=A0AAW0PPY0_9GOBI
MFKYSEVWMFKYSEDSLLEVFRHFGPVVRTVGAEHTGVKHTFVEFVNAQSRQAALSSAPHLLQLNYLLCPALTPLHLSAPVSPAHTHLSAPVSPATRTCLHLSAPPSRPRTCLHLSAPLPELRKLDRRLGKVFRSLLEGTLSVVVLRGSRSSPGLCFMEIKK